MNASSILRIGLIGAGGVAARHVQTLAGFPDAAVVAVADLDAARGAELASHCPGASSYGDPERMLDAEAPDAAYVCVPPFAHGDPEMACIRRGIPFFVEKPLSVDIAVAERVGRAVADAGLITATGYHWRYFDTVTEARRLLADHPPRLVLGSWLDKVPPPAWWVVRERSGGQIVEQLTHVLDLLRVLVGEVDAVHAHASRRPRPDQPDRDIDDVTVATLHLTCGVLGTLAATSLLRHKHRAGLEVIADGLAVEVTETALSIDRDGTPSTRPPGNDAKIAVDRAFLDAVSGRGDDVRAPYAEALRTHRLGTAIAASAATGQRVCLRSDGAPR